MPQDDAKIQHDARVRRQVCRATLIDFFCARFPSAFSVEKPIPLKKRCLVDVAIDWEAHRDDYPACSKLLLREAFGVYTSRKRYHQACITNNAMRIDLQGEPVEVVTDAEKEYHLQRLAKKKSKY
jgi:sRNA-binding protein